MKGEEREELWDEAHLFYIEKELNGVVGAVRGIPVLCGWLHRGIRE